WNEEQQWQPLWQDIAERADAVLARSEGGSSADRIGNHFLGAVVLNQIRVYGRSVDTVEVIDGQQRLTTLQLMLAAFRDVMREVGSPIAHDLSRLTENDGIREHEEERFKVWPTNADRTDFEAAMRAGTVAALEEQYPLRRRRYARTPEPRPRLVEAYLFFARCVREYCFPPLIEAEGAEPTFSPARADALFEALRRHVQLV